MFRVAERLGITRQAVNRSMAWLVDENYVSVECKPGRALRYQITVDHVKDERRSGPTIGTKRWRHAKENAKRRAAKVQPLEVAGVQRHEVAQRNLLKKPRKRLFKERPAARRKPPPLAAPPSTEVAGPF